MIPTVQPADSPVRGILLMCAAVFCFVVMNTFVKELTIRDYPVPLIIWARYFFHLVLIVAFFPRRLPTLLVSRRKGWQVVRSVLVLLATLCMFTALQYLPLANIVAITFVAPLLVTGLSVVVLGERVGHRRWAAVAAGFVGVLVIIRPGFGIVHWAAILPLGMAGFYAAYQTITRYVRGATGPLNSLFYTALVGATVTSVAAPFFWATPAPQAWPMLVAVGLFGGLGHLAMIGAYEAAPASVVAPFAYSELIWAVLFGLAVFGDLPDGWTLAGAALIAGSGLYVLHRERVRAVAAGGAP